MGDATDGCDPPMTIWLLRAVWATLPLTAGPAAAEALRTWAGPPRTLAAAILWVAWAAGLLATFAPRPWGLTVTRTVGPLFVAAALAAVVDGSPAAPGAGALAATGLAALLSGSPAFGVACANGAAYGDESRFPLKTPPPLFVGVLPVAVLVVGAGAVSGPLLLTDRHWLAGAVLTVVGWAAVGATVPMIHRLSRRWVVLVPAGLVIADPLTLADPTLFPRERIRSLAPCAGPRAPGGALDLRLGALRDGVTVTLAEEATLLRAARLQMEALPFTTDTLLVAPVAPAAFLTEAGSRRIPVAPAG